MNEHSAGASGSARAVAASAWIFRWKVEREAAVRFERLARCLEASDAPRHLAVLARRAADDERRHAMHCERLAAQLGERVEVRVLPDPPAVAPTSLVKADAVTYEMVAACCVSETISVAVLTSLLAAARDDALRRLLRELARDEVTHARLGWAYLAVVAGQGRTAFLGALLPGMLRGSIEDDLFRHAAPERDDEELLALGVLPRATKRELFVSALERVVFPGLEGSRVDTSAARRWLAAQSVPR